MTESTLLEEPAGLVLLAELERDASVVDALRSAFQEAGFRVVVVNAADFASDREATAAVEEAFSALLADLPGRRRVGVLGLGEPGERALIIGCTSRQVGFVVSAFGPLIRDGLDEAHPSQPLELALNLDAPFLLLRGSGATAVPEEHVALLRTKLDAFFRTYEVVEFEGPGVESLRPHSAGYNSETAAGTVSEIVRLTMAFAADALD